MAVYLCASELASPPFISDEQAARAASKVAALEDDASALNPASISTNDQAVAARIQAKLAALDLEDELSDDSSLNLEPLYGADASMGKPVYPGTVAVNLAAVLRGINIDECDAEGENAFFVLDMAVVRRQHLQWLVELPRVMPFYAVKCNPDPYMLRLLDGLGTGFDCASNAEIQSVLDLGVSPKRIVYANPCKAASFVRQAKRQHIELATFDNADELDKMARFHPTCKLVVRILADDSRSVCQLGLKFGAPVAAVPALLAKAKALNLSVVGVSFHVGSGCFDPLAFRDAIARARAAFDMGDEAGYTFSLLDIGGGFEAPTFAATAAVLRQAIDDYFPSSMYPAEAEGKRSLRIIAEPGRFYAAPAFTLAANIIARRDRTSDAPPLNEDERAHGGTLSSALAPAGETAAATEVMVYQNDGVYGAFNCIMFDHQEVRPKVLTLQRNFVYDPAAPPPGIRARQAELVPCSVWGPTCDSIDCVSRAALLPAAGPNGLEVGDWLVYEQLGAYTLCAASAFNGIPTASVRYCLGSEGEDAAAVRGILNLHPAQK